MRCMFAILVAAIGAAVGASAGSAAAQTSNACGLPSGNFALRLQVGPECATAAMITAQSFFDRLNPDTRSGLRSILPSYTSTSVAQVAARFSGLGLSLEFPDAGPTVQFSIPALSYYRTFTGITRDESIDALVDDIKNGDIVGRIMAYQAENSPTSPITGVGGLMVQSIAIDFNQNFGNFATQIAGPLQEAQAGGNASLAGAALIIGAFSTDSADGVSNNVKVATLPLSYTLRNEIDPRRQLVLSLPISVVDINGAQTYAGGLGLGYRFPMNDSWTLVHSGRISAVGSGDLATVSGVYSLSMTSVYIWDVGSLNIAMGNMVSYNATTRVKSGEYSFDPNISNTSMRNGLLLSQPMVWDGRRMSMEYSLLDTRFIGGNKPYVDNYQELGITVGTNKNAFTARTFIRGGITATFGKGTRGASANIGYWF